MESVQLLFHFIISGIEVVFFTGLSMFIQPAWNKTVRKHRAKYLSGLRTGLLVLMNLLHIFLDLRMFSIKVKEKW